MKKNEDKTNVCRLLDHINVSYEYYSYSSDIVDGLGVADALGEDPDKVFKTLVTVSDDNEHFVFMIPVNCSLNLKKAAKIAGVKKIDMIKQKELCPLTGYIHGGCSPIGMKKKFPTFIEETASLFDTIYYSAGQVGKQVKTSLEDLIKMTDCKLGDLI